MELTQFAWLLRNNVELFVVEATVRRLIGTDQIHVGVGVDLVLHVEAPVGCVYRHPPEPFILVVLSAPHGYVKDLAVFPVLPVHVFTHATGNGMSSVLIGSSGLRPVSGCPITKGRQSEGRALSSL